MYRVSLDFNTKVNPCVLTPYGEYVPNHHSILIRSDDRVIQKIFGNWYITTLWVGSDNMGTIGKEQFSEIISKVRTEVGNYITFDTADEFIELFNNKVNDICAQLDKFLPQSVNNTSISPYMVKHNHIGKMFTTLKSGLTR
jgi:hypothetical protein